MKHILYTSPNYEQGFFLHEPARYCKNWNTLTISHKIYLATYRHFNTCPPLSSPGLGTLDLKISLDRGIIDWPYCLSIYCNAWQPNIYTRLPFLRNGVFVFFLYFIKMLGRSGRVFSFNFDIYRFLKWIECLSYIVVESTKGFLA